MPGLGIKYSNVKKGNKYILLSGGGCHYTLPFPKIPSLLSIKGMVCKKNIVFT